MNFVFLTLVLSGSAALSAPVVDRSPAPIKISPDQELNELTSSRQETRDWSLRLGFFGGALNEIDRAEQFYFYGLRYTGFRETLAAWDLEFTMARKNFLHLKVGRKYYFPLETVTLPYYKFGIGNMIESGENLASVFNFKKIQATAAVGLDDLFRWNRYLQIEVAASYAIIGPQLEMSLGFAF